METLLLPLILIGGGFAADHIDEAYMDVGMAVRDSAFDTPNAENLESPLGLVEFGFESKHGPVVALEHMSSINVSDGYGINYLSVKYRIK